MIIDATRQQSLRRHQQHTPRTHRAAAATVTTPPIMCFGLKENALFIDVGVAAAAAAAAKGWKWILSRLDTATRNSACGGRTYDGSK